MKANETQIIRLVEGTNQYFVPHFQRSYSWGFREWQTLYDDIKSLTELEDSEMLPENRTTHFLGSIVTMPGHSIPEGISKYILIDGQQRLSTLLIFLIAIKDRAREIGEKKLHDKISDLYLSNRYQDEDDKYKLLPTQNEDPKHNDRLAFKSLIDNNREVALSDSKIYKAYDFFKSVIDNEGNGSCNLYSNIILNRLILVSIVLERDDNPYAIFESLNAKGQPLSQADLIRNYFFMCIDSRHHDEIHKNKWKPMERSVGQENMTEFLRHFLMMSGQFVKKSDVYFKLKSMMERKSTDAIAILDELITYSRYYAKFLNPDLEPCKKIRGLLKNLDSFKATVTFPFLLNIFSDRECRRLSDDDVVEILEIIENFLVRRYVCGTIRAELNKIFPLLHMQASKFMNLSIGIREILSSRNYPSNDRFLETLLTKKLYGSGEKRERTKYILEKLEAHMNQKEHLNMGEFTIEHIMPQKLNEWWKNHLGESCNEIHEDYLHTLGNLTLTMQNQELSNMDLSAKQEIFNKSRLFISRGLLRFSDWNEAVILERSRSLAKIALKVWPNLSLGDSSILDSVTGKTPKVLHVLGEKYEVTTWQDVLKITLQEYYACEDRIVSTLVKSFPKNISHTSKGLRKPKNIGPNFYYTSHLNAQQINDFCRQVSQQLGFTSEDWKVEVHN